MVAKRAGKKPSTIRGYMNGTFEPSLTVLARICTALGISPDEIFVAAGFPFVPDEASRIAGLVQNLVTIRARRPSARRARCSG